MMTGKYYMLFQDDDLDVDKLKKLHWFVDHHIPNSRKKYEHEFIKSNYCWGTIRSGVQGVYTWDNGKFMSLCFFDRLIFAPDITKDYTEVFYNADSIILGELSCTI